LNTSGTTTAQDSRRLRRVGLIALICAVVLAVGGILWRQVHERRVAQWTQDQAVPTVPIVTPTRGPEHSELVLPGNLQAWYEAPLYARVSGYLKNWYFDYGAHVKKGQVLAEIDAPDLDAQLLAARAQLKAAQASVNVRRAQADFAHTTFERWEGSPKGSVSLQEIESKRGDDASAEASLRAAEANVGVDQGDVDRLTALEGFKRITAPFDGIVTARETDIGALINVGSGGNSGPELFRVADVHEMRVFVPVPQRISAGVVPGLAASLMLPQFGQRTFPASVATTARAIDPNTRTLTVELHALNPDENLPPGSYTEVHFELPAQPDTVLIPDSALLFRQNGLEVAVLGPGNRIRLERVTAGRNLGTQIEIVGGLTLSDRIVNTPPDSLAAGDLVRPQDDAPTRAAGLAERELQMTGRALD
jgi:RND family efflux transporter MFP subunit